MKEDSISANQAKLILEEYLSNQIRRVLAQTKSVNTGDSWSINFAGLPAEQFSISKKGDLLIIMQGEYEIEINY